MPRSDVFKKGQGDKKNLNSKPERPPVDAYGNVKKEIETDEDIEPGDGIAVAVVETEPLLPPKPEPLPPWLQHFRRIPINQIHPGDYQKRLSSEQIPERIKKDAQLEAQMRESHDRGLLQLDVHVMQDPDDPEVYYPCQGMHRRIEITQKIGITEVTCYVHPYDRDGLAQGTYFENSDFARLELNIIEEGMIFQQSLDDHPLWDQIDVAKFYKIPDPGAREHVSKCVVAARAMPDVQKLVFEDPNRATRIVGVLSQLDKIDDCVAKRKPIIDGFLAGKLNAAQVDLIVDAILSGKEFTLDENKASKGTITPRVISRYERAVAFRKGLASYSKLIGDDPPSDSERSELIAARDEINNMLSRA